MEPVAGTLRTMSTLRTCVVVMVIEEVAGPPAGLAGPAPWAAAGLPSAAGAAASGALFRPQPEAATATPMIAMRRTFCRRRGRRKGVVALRIGRLSLSDIRWLI